MKKIIKEKDNYGGEYYLVKNLEKKASFDIEIEEVRDFEAFCCSYRKQPFFMNAKTGKKTGAIPKESQWLGIKHTERLSKSIFSRENKISKLL